MAMATDGPDTLSTLLEAQRKLKDVSAMVAQLPPTQVNAPMLVDLQMLTSSLDRAVNFNREMADAYYFSD